MHRVVGRGLIGHHVGTRTARLHPAHEFGEHIGRVADQCQRLRLAGRRPAFDGRQRIVDVMRLFIAIARADAEIGPRLVAFDGEAAGPRHHRRQGLGAAHAAQARRQDPPALEVAAVMLPPGLGEGLVGALHDALGTDVDPRPRRHLAVHHQALAIELAEMRPGRPVRHEVRVRDQHARRVRVGAEHAHRLARLDQQRLVRLQRLQCGDDAVEVVPGARRPADAAVDHQLVRVLCHVGMQVVHQHPHRRLGQPALGGDLGAGRGVDVAHVVAGVGHDAPSRVGAMSASVVRISASRGRSRPARASS